MGELLCSGGSWWMTRALLNRVNRRQASKMCSTATVLLVAMAAVVSGNVVMDADAENEMMRAMEDMSKRSSFQDDCVAAHNELRRHHQNTPDLQWDDQLAAESQMWSEKLAREDRGMYHSKAKDYGENLYQGMGKVYTCFDAVKAWYDEIKDYSYSTTKPTRRGRMIGHFTQVVWTDSTKMGAGMAKSRSGWVYICARYRKKGNFVMMMMGERYSAARRRVYGAKVQPLKNAGDDLIAADNMVEERVL